MSVLIRRMALPKNCEKCQFCVNGFTDEVPQYISPVNGFCVMGVTEEDIGLAKTVIEAEGEKDGR